MNRSIVYYNPNSANKTQLKTLKRIEDDLQKEMYRQIGIVSGSFGIALYENWGWREKRIGKFFQEIVNAWEECAKDPDISMLEMCENETGIVIGIPGCESSYKDLIFFTSDTRHVEMTIEKRICMRLSQKKWLGPEMIAAALVSLHRIYNFGYDRLSKVYQQMEEVRNRYNWDADTIEKECYAMTNVAIDVK